MNLFFWNKKLTDKDKYCHVLITHFNLDYSKMNFNIPHNNHLNPDWLDGRFELFEKYCFPSIVSQTCKNFIWLCAFHKDTPEPYRTRILGYASKCPQMKIIWEGDCLEYFDNLSNIVKANIPHKKYVVTTRLDNDDAFSCDYIENIQKNLIEHDNCFFDFRYGYIYDNKNDVLYIKRYKRNPFVSKIELYDNLTTVRACPHEAIHMHGKVKTIMTKPMFLQIIHGGNVYNKVQGKLVKNRKDFYERFIVKNDKESY